MNIASINMVNNYSQVSKVKNNQLNSFEQTDFLKLITAQLKYQNPLSPVSNFDFMSQAAQFSTLEQVINLNTRLGFLTDLFEMTYANSFLGKEVGWKDESGEYLTGKVEKIERKDGVLWLYSQGKYIAPSWVTLIKSNETIFNSEPKNNY